METTRPATAADLPGLAAVLASAFRGYAWTDWTVPADRREERIRELQLLHLRHAALPHGMVWTTDDLAAVSAFVPAPSPELPPDVLEQLVAMHGDRFGALVETERLLTAHRPPHRWVLATIGTAPSARGRGLGTAVARAGLEVLDQQDATCLVETSDPANLSLYCRLGFGIDHVVTAEGPPVWILTRHAAR